MDWFTFNHNRSERAKQTELLAPVLRSLDGRDKLLSGIENITREELEKVNVMHFVWVLRDTFTFERDIAELKCNWSQLVSRWSGILKLPSWANDLDYWRHPTGYSGINSAGEKDPDYVVHPVQKRLGWTKQGLKFRYNILKPNMPEDKVSPILQNARRIMNTECDCFIQTTKRLIVIECKDKTGFKEEQRKRQRMLFDCLERLIERPRKLCYIELGGAGCDAGDNHFITWDKVESCLCGA
jgi:hypothetical protein